MTSASASDSGSVQVTPSAGSCALAASGESIATEPRSRRQGPTCGSTCGPPLASVEGGDEPPFSKKPSSAAQAFHHRPAVAVTEAAPATLLQAEAPPIACLTVPAPHRSMPCVDPSTLWRAAMPRKLPRVRTAILAGLAALSLGGVAVAAEGLSPASAERATQAPPSTSGDQAASGHGQAAAFVRGPDAGGGAASAAAGRS